MSRETCAKCGAVSIGRSKEGRFVYYDCGSFDDAEGGQTHVCLKKKVLYRVAWTWYETYNSYLVEGPEVPDWEKYLISLLPEAATLALNEQQEKNNWLGWDEIVECLVAVLVTRGYKHLQPQEVKFFGCNILQHDRIDVGKISRWAVLEEDGQGGFVELEEVNLWAGHEDLLKQICDHNKSVQEELDESSRIWYEQEEAKIKEIE